MVELKYDEDGLIPAVIQEYETKQVLMLAYMNEESLRKTINSGMTWFYSRSRQELWNKGATSGNYQHVKTISYDCDGDALLIQVIQDGVACHTGHYSCFYKEMIQRLDEKDIESDIVNRIVKTIKDRKINHIEGSYTNYLLEKGIDKILKKVGEETAEVIIASKNPAKDELIYELSDLIYHVLVLMEIKEVSLDDIKNELNRRHNK